MSLEPPRAERVSRTMVDLYMDALVGNGGWLFPDAIAWILRMLRACQNRN